MNDIIESEAWQRAKEAIDKLVSALSKLLDRTIIRFIHYPNKNIIRLALYAKKRRVRKKNFNKILNWLNANKE